jgi:hypothetical protein
MQQRRSGKTPPATTPKSQKVKGTGIRIKEITRVIERNQNQAQGLEGIEGTHVWYKGEQIDQGGLVKQSNQLMANCSVSTLLLITSEQTATAGAITTPDATN